MEPCKSLCVRAWKRTFYMSAFVLGRHVIFFRHQKRVPGACFHEARPSKALQTRSLKYKMCPCIHMRTLMTEWVIAPSVGYVFSPADLKTLFLFPRYGHFKSSKGPPQILHCKLLVVLNWKFQPHAHKGALSSDLSFNAADYIPGIRRSPRAIKPLHIILRIRVTAGA